MRDRVATLLPLLVLAPACVHDKETAETAGFMDETACAEAEALLGFPACVPRISDEDVFTSVTISSTSIDQMRVGKHMVPAVDDARVPPVFLDVNHFTLHYDFLVSAFPELFPGLAASEYEQLILYPDTREFYAGTYSLYQDEDGFFYGFTVWDDPADSSSTVTVDDVTAAWEVLQERFEIGELYWVPYSSAQEEAARGWDPPFPTRALADVEYEVYNQGTSYGSLRLYTLETLEEATETAEFGYQDIVAIDEAPSDLERVVSGIITGTRQGDLSHLNVRSASRGTPNCYLADPLEALADWQDQLVAFTCGEDDWSVTSATTEQAQAWWDSIRPDPVEVCEPLYDETDMPGLLELATDTSDERSTGICTYGSKGTNLATLYQRIDTAYQLDGFLVPVHYYQQFIQDNTWRVDLGEGEADYSFAATLDAWHEDEAFLTDAAVRRERLEALRDAMGDAPVDQDLVSALTTRIRDIFGGDEIMVRFRSSSNAEDDLEFSGAGLYESESVCLADELDDDELGPSRCDQDKSGEETVRDGLTEVWSSLWKMQAWEERDWYGIDPSKVAMAILVNTRSKDEQANMVAFTGNPTSDDDRYLINAQEGETEVVSTESGVYPEKLLITMSDCDVEDIYRTSYSSELDEGVAVLTDAEISELASLLCNIALIYPNDQEVPDDQVLLWDTEWKILSDGRMIIKQIRPYLR